MSFTATTSNSAAAWRPDIFEFAPTDVVPDALILQCTTVAGSVEGDAPVARVAYVVDDAAQISIEADVIPESDPGLSERLVHTSKITQLVRLSREQYQQTGTAAQLSVSVARAITRRANTLFVAENAPTAPAVAPVAGLINTGGLIDGGTVSTSLDPVIDLVAALEANLAKPSAILVDPHGWAGLRKLKRGTADGNMSLLGAGTTDAQQLLLSLPVIVDVSLPAYRGLVIDRTAIVSAVGPIMISTSEHTYFANDSVGLRATWRVGHVVVRPERLGRFAVGGGS